MQAARVQGLVGAGPAPRQAFTVASKPAAARRRSPSFIAADQSRHSEAAAAAAEPPAAAHQQQQRRRQLLSVAGAALLAAAASQVPAAHAVIKGYEPMPGLQGKDYGKQRMTYSDYVQSPTGLQYQDLRVGQGPAVQAGQMCVVDWSGVTIGYYGRPFEARNKAKGGAFTGDEKEFFRFRLGDKSVIPAFDEAVMGMQAGGVRRIIVPVELGYPDNDYNKAGPKPTTFSGKRALGFVLGNQGMIDKTLLFDIELIAIR